MLVLVEGTLFPNRPVLPAPAPRQTQQPSKLTPNFLPPQSPPPPPPSFHLDSLLEHLQHLSSVPITTLMLTLVPASKQKKPSLASDPVVEQEQLDDTIFGFLSDKGKLLLDSIVGSPLHELNGFFNSVEFELLEVDFLGLLKALDLSGKWKRVLLLFEWGWLHFRSEQNLRLDNQVVELTVQILGKESQHSIASKSFDLIPVEQYLLDVRAYTMLQHSSWICRRGCGSTSSGALQTNMCKARTKFQQHTNHRNKWTPPPTPTSGASVFSRIANTSPTDAAALASHPFPHSNALLSACSTLDALATSLPLFPSTTFAVMCFADTKTLNTYLIPIPIPTLWAPQYILGLPHWAQYKSRNPVFNPRRMWQQG
ncbi:hypothetical protein V8G54_028550 [Vigna mungo]|uniref:Uncharacterized protein n=1 Tax=Vigna mungo TaxID=3915 RepID=A0AAQ3MRM4_VIGMU